MTTQTIDNSGTLSKKRKKFQHPIQIQAFSLPTKQYTLGQQTKNPQWLLHHWNLRT
jgi:hypothetical protein